MERKRVLYVGYYDTPDSKQQREYYPAATNFMDYIAQVLVDDGYAVEIVSMSPTKGAKPANGGRRALSNEIWLKTFFSIGDGNSFFHRINIHLIRFEMFIYLLTKIKKNDILLVYHSLNYAKVIMVLRKLRIFRFVLQVCEIYQDVTDNLANKLKKAEFEIFQRCDACIYSNDLIREKLDPDHRRESLVLYGVYKTHKPDVTPFADGKIHVVYAGTLDHRKGAGAAAEAAKYLDNRIHIHILGFGGEEQIAHIMSLVENHNGDSTLTFDGLLQGEAFSSFMAKCDIGLCTQSMDATFSDTSFPSKILTYLAYGLCVVSVRLKAVEISKIGNQLCFIDSCTPEAVAEGIQAALRNHEPKSSTLLTFLDKQLHEELRELLEG